VDANLMQRMMSALSIKAGTSGPDQLASQVVVVTATL
jgi:hypothetical protein